MWNNFSHEPNTISNYNGIGTLLAHIPLKYAGHTFILEALAVCISVREVGGGGAPSEPLSGVAALRSNKRAMAASRIGTIGARGSEGGGTTLPSVASCQGFGLGAGWLGGVHNA